MWNCFKAKVIGFTFIQALTTCNTFIKIFKKIFYHYKTSFFSLFWQLQWRSIDLHENSHDTQWSVSTGVLFHSIRCDRCVWSFSDHRDRVTKPPMSITATSRPASRSLYINLMLLLLSAYYGFFQVNYYGVYFDKSSIRHVRLIR